MVPCGARRNRNPSVDAGDLGPPTAHGPADSHGVTRMVAFLVERRQRHGMWSTRPVATRGCLSKCGLRCPKGGGHERTTWEWRMVVATTARGRHAFPLGPLRPGPLPWRKGRRIVRRRRRPVRSSSNEGRRDVEHHNENEKQEEKRLTQHEMKRRRTPSAAGPSQQRQRTPSAVGRRARPCRAAVRIVSLTPDRVLRRRSAVFSLSSVWGRGSRLRVVRFVRESKIE